MIRCTRLFQLALSNPWLRLQDSRTSSAALVSRLGSFEQAWSTDSALSMTHCSRALRDRVFTHAAAASVDTHPRADAILRFWLGEGYQSAPKNSGPGDKVSIWYGGGAEFDQLCSSEFKGDLEDSYAGRLDAWKQGYNGLAHVILMDQLSRNIYRGSPKTFELDARALELAKAIHDSSSTASFPPVQRIWLYMPLMHSENIRDLELCAQRYEALASEAQGLSDSEDLQKLLASNVDFTLKHKEVVAQWGRYPHRNKILGRKSTPEEEAGLEDGSIPRF